MRKQIDRVTKAFEMLVVALAAVGALIIVVQMLWISYGVFMRYAMGAPDRMVTEATALLLFPVALVGLAYAMREDSYPRVTLLTDRLRPATRKLVGMFNGSIMLLIGIFLSITTITAAMNAYRSGSSTEILQWPRYLFWGIGALALTVFTVYAALRLLQLVLRPASEMEPRDGMV
jgi:TRAP-type C4-dicarboxylate transport system permease small subunit